jgi:serine/threonine protein kinase
MGKKSKRQQSRKHRGGGLIGKGTYGCVYKPSLPCTDPNFPSRDNYITKVGSKEELAIEMEKAEFVSRVDPEEKYFISKTESCSWPAGRTRETRALIASTCKHVYNEYEPNLWAVNYVYGGQTLMNYCENAVKSNTTLSFRTLMTGFIHLIRGLSLIHEDGIYHHDIKPLNIVISEDTKLPRFIDLGLSSTLGDMMTNANDIFYSGYTYWPPESLLLVALGNNHLTLYESEISAWRDFYGLKVANQSLMLFGFDMSYGKEKIVNIMRDCRKIKTQVDRDEDDNTILTEEQENLLEGMCRRVDTFGLCLSLLSCLNILSHHLDVDHLVLYQYRKRLADFTVDMRNIYPDQLGTFIKSILHEQYGRKRTRTSSKATTSTSTSLSQSYGIGELFV